MPAFLILLFLAALWGSSFLFIRITAGVMHPFWLSEFRLFYAVLFLTVFVWVVLKRFNVRRYFYFYLILGACNSAIPFSLFNFSAPYLSTGVLAILNATTPMWGAIVGYFWLRQPLTRQTLFGLLLGFIGVVVIVAFKHPASEQASISHGQYVLACVSILIATFFYGVAANLPGWFSSRSHGRSANDIHPLELSQGSLMGGMLLLLPFLLWAPTPELEWEGMIDYPMLSLMALGVFCTGLAFAVFFKLIEMIGVSSTLTVAYLIPMFAAFWGYIFLGEALSEMTLLGSAIVLMGTALTVGIKKKPPRLSTEVD